MTILEVIFWLSASVLVHTYLVYPLLMWGLSRLRKPHRRLAIEPSVSLLLLAHEARGDLRHAIENLLVLDYPAARREIVVVCESGKTAAVLARRFGWRGVRFHAGPPGTRRAALLNELVPRLRGDVVVLVDGDRRLERGALRALVTHFADPGTGAVSGYPVAGGREQLSVGEEFESFLRECESRVHSTVCTTIALFALRKRLYTPLPENSVMEDTLLTLALWRDGYRVHFEPRALVREDGEVEAGVLHPVRSLSDALHLLRRGFHCLNPFDHPLWLQSFSHRFLRLLGPFCLVAVLGSNIALLDQPPYHVMLGLQVLFYALALAGHRDQGAVFNIPRAICELSWAQVRTATRAVLARPYLRWEKAQG